MAKLAALILAAMAVESLKPLAETAKAELGEYADLDIKEIGAQIKAGQQSASELKTLGSEITKLKADGAEVVTLKATNERITGSLRRNVIESQFVRRAAEYGIKPTAIETAKSVADFSKIAVDLDRGEASGFDQSFFDGLKSKHSILFMTEDEKKASAAAAVSAISALPPAGTGTAALQGKPGKIAGPIGSFLAADGMK